MIYVRNQELSNANTVKALLTVLHGKTKRKLKIYNVKVEGCVVLQLLQRNREARAKLLFCSVLNLLGWLLNGVFHKTMF